MIGDHKRYLSHGVDGKRNGWKERQMARMKARKAQARTLANHPGLARGLRGTQPGQNKTPRAVGSMVAPSTPRVKTPKVRPVTPTATPVSATPSVAETPAAPKPVTPATPRPKPFAPGGTLPPGIAKKPGFMPPGQKKKYA